MTFIMRMFSRSGLVSRYSFDAGDATDDEGSNDGTVTGATLTADRFGNPKSGLCI
jgi:hypothetical protein